MKNPCRELRQLLGVSQVEFSRLIECSYPSLQNYEKHPEDTPAEVIDRIRSLAAETEHADWAVPLLSDEWRVTTVIYPGETLISAPKPKPRTAGSSLPGMPDRDELHAMLDDVLDSGNPEAIQAVVPNLVLFQKFVNLKSDNRKVPKKRKGA
jgi:ParB-like chromosome segregation protein Spo0J